MISAHHPLDLETAVARAIAGQRFNDRKLTATPTAEDIDQVRHLARAAIDAKAAFDASIADQLAAENEMLRQTVHTLLTVGSALNDAIGLWTMPTIPNN